MWACGVMLFRLVAGAYPFERADERADPQRMNKMADVSLFHVTSRQLLKRSNRTL